MSCKYFVLDLSFLVGCGRFPPNFCSPKLRTFCLLFPNICTPDKNRRNCRISPKLTRIKKFVFMSSSYFSILRSPCFIKLFHPSQFERDTAIPPIFVRSTNVRSWGEQKFVGNLPQPTWKFRSRKKYLQDILENQLNL